MRRTANTFEEFAAWFCSGLLAFGMLALTAVICGILFIVFKALGAFAVLIVWAFAALTYGIRRYLW